MYLGRVVGCVWSTAKNREMLGHRLLIVQPLTPQLKETGKRLICGDAMGAGAGELVYWVRGKEASFPFAPGEPPFDTTIVGIVDSIHVPSVPPESSIAPAAQAQSPNPPADPNHRAPAGSRRKNSGKGK